MKKVCRAVAGMVLWGAIAWGQEVPVPGDEAVAAATVPPVILRDVRVQSIGEERWNEELPSGLLFIDAEDGDLCIADEDNPHGRVVCPCKNVDRHSFTNDLKINGHRILLNDSFSLQAEGSAVSLRHGTNAILQVLAEDYGNLAPLTAAFEDETHLLLTANAPADAVLQTTTNLLDPAGWQPAANAVVAAATDAATTWRITLLDGTVPEFYRVLATVSRPAGIHANAPLHANSGIEMDGTTWTSFPDTNAFLTAETDATALAALAAETSARTAADSALDGAVASVERRVEALECPETCVLWWTTNLQSGGEYYIPTNFPTKRLEVRVNRTGLASCVLIIDCSWSPASDVEIDIISYAESAGTNAVRIANGQAGGTVYTGNTSGTQTRRWLVSFDATTGLWRSYFFTVDSQFGVVSKAVNPAGGSTFEPTGPVTVEEWVAAWKARQNGTPALSLSPSPALLFPAALQPEEEPLDAPDFDDPQDPETDR